MNNSHPKKILEFEKILSACNSWLCYERTSFSNPQKITFLHENANTRNFAMNNSHPKNRLEFKKILMLAIRDYPMKEHHSQIRRKLCFYMKMQIRGILLWIIPIQIKFLNSKKFFCLQFRIMLWKNIILKSAKKYVFTWKYRHVAFLRMSPQVFLKSFGSPCTAMRIY